jgi:SAM-dependent methyltransferase
MGRSPYRDIPVPGVMSLLEKLHADKTFRYLDGRFEHLTFKQHDFEDTYIALRRKEGRIFSDSEVAMLPSVHRAHPLKDEWAIRKSSARKLFHYIKSKAEAKLILEVGCGNGWLSNMLSEISSDSVIGIDINGVELQQASRVFHSKHNLAFVAGNIFDISFPVKFDAIVLASSLQYFKDLNQLITLLLTTLSDRGEIHIIDTPIYDDNKVQWAKDRSAKYFAVQESNMTQHYFHHSWNEINKFNYQIASNPQSLRSKLMRWIFTGSPFPWLIIKKP